MPRRTAALVAAPVVALAAPAVAPAATLQTDAQCYVQRDLMNISGTAWTPGSTFAVSGSGVSATGFADPLGNWSTQVTVPSVANPGIKPATVRLSGTQDGVEVASTTFKVINFIVQPKSLNGNPTESTTWIFGGFAPGKRIYFHIKRGKRVYTSKAGKGAAPCGTLKKRLPRIPGVPAGAIRDGAYKVFVDNRRTFKQGGLQYRATINVT